MAAFAKQHGYRNGGGIGRAAALALLLAIAFLLLQQGFSGGVFTRQQLDASCGEQTAWGDDDGPPPGQLPPGTIPMEHPSRQAFDRVQADPGLAERDAALAEEFEAAPWLLPPRSAALRYAGVTALDTLAELRSVPQGEAEKAVAVTLFSRGVAAVAQNALYSMVKFAGVRNHLVATWDAADLAACADLNLPCADASHLLAAPLERPGDPTDRDKLLIRWLRPALLAHLTAAGFAVLVADADVAWTLAPAWASLLGFAATLGGDGVLPDRQYRGGVYLALPTPAGAAAWANWSAAAGAAVAAGLDDFEWLAGPGGEAAPLARCAHPGCAAVVRAEAEQAGRPPGAIARSYLHGWRMVSPDGCALDRPGAPLLDLCDWTILHLHPCSPLEGVRDVYRRQGVWLLDDEAGCPGRGASNVSACLPLRWRQPDAEAMYYACPAYGIALWHVPPQLRDPPGGAAAQGGGEL